MNQVEKNADRITLFWPSCLMALSLAVFLGWQVALSVQQYIGSVRVAEQQGLLEAQAVQTEATFQAMVMDLITLAKTDTDAREIVNTYGIQFNPAASTPLPAEAVAPKPGVLPALPVKAAAKEAEDKKN